MPATPKNLRSCSPGNGRQALTFTHRNGRWAEALVRRELNLQGWSILKQNFRVKHSEIDLIARKGKTVIFVEVKFRRNADQFWLMDGLIGFRKIRALRYGAHCFIQRELPEPGYTFRFDLAVVSQSGKIDYRTNFI